MTSHGYGAEEHINLIFALLRYRCPVYVFCLVFPSVGDDTFTAASIRDCTVSPERITRKSSLLGAIDARRRTGNAPFNWAWYQTLCTACYTPCCECHIHK